MTIKLAVRLACLSGWWVTMAVAAAPATTPFVPRHFPYEPRAPLLAGADAGDQLATATVTASAHDEEQRPDLVLNHAIHDDTVMFWSAKDLPAWLKFELSAAKEIAQLNLHLRAPNTRVFNFFIEGLSYKL